MIKIGKAIIIMGFLLLAGLALGIRMGATIQKANYLNELKAITEDNERRIELLNERIDELKEMITNAEKMMIKTGIASYYAEPFHGRKTASGEIFDKNKMTAASKDLPFNTHWRIMNMTNGLSTVIRINDIGPFVGNRIIDLSEAAAKAIGMKDQGIFKSKDKPDIKCQKSMKFVLLKNRRRENECINSINYINFNISIY